MVLIFEIIGLVLVTAHIVDLLEEKGRPSLLFKFLTPIAWFGGQFMGSVLGTIGLAIAGTDVRALSSPNASVMPEHANALFLLFLASIAGTLAGVGIVYLIARRLPAIPSEEST